MAAGEDFTMAPSEVVELEPEYNNIITPTESMKKEYLNLSATALQKYKITFNVLTTANKDTLLTHFKANYGEFHSFTWKSVPSYIESGANITGRWVTGSLSITPIGYKRWTCSVIIEKGT